MAKAKKTIEEQLADAEARVQKLKEKLATKPIDENSPGVKELIDSFEKVCKDNNNTPIEVIKALSRIKNLSLAISKKKPIPQ
jgi:hypothetical protein